MTKLQKQHDNDPALQALRAAVTKVVEEHRKSGRPLALWRDGKAVWVPVDQIGTIRETPPPYRTKSGH